MKTTTPQSSGAASARGAPVRVSRRGAVAVVALDSPPVNALSRTVRAALLRALLEFRDDDSAKIAALTGVGKAFCAGADIREFSSAPSAPSLPEIAALMDEMEKPLAALLHGAALGGGLELALCCHYRAILPGAKAGLPEVRLGVIPGAGGTQRLPRLIGAEAALEMISAGKVADAERALALGLADKMLEPDAPEAAAYSFAHSLLMEGAPVRRVSESRAAECDAEVFARRRARLKKRDAGAFAPFRCVDAVECATTLPFAEGLRREREMFLECLKTPQRAGLVHAFFAEKRATKTKTAGAKAKVQEIKSAAVAGGGRMGAGIALCFAAAGIPTRITESNPAALRAGLERARMFCEEAVRRGRLDEADMAGRLAPISGAADYDELGGADLVIEAVTEDLDLKREVFRSLDAACKPGAILATNTSSLDINALSEVVSRPERFAGAHFFNPAPVMRLLEVARARETSEATMSSLLALGRRLGKVAVAVGACPGFVGNRMSFAYGREAEFLLEEGATPERVDGVMRGFGMAMGPLETRDLAGIDNGWNIRGLLWRDLPAEFRRPRVLEALHRAKRLGRESGAGYYRYDGPGGEAASDPAALRIVEEVSAAAGIVRREIGEEEILRRCLCALVNEGAKVLEEGVAARAGDIDVVHVHGFGFPARRGGPMFWAEREGLKKILGQVREFHESLGAWWAPSPLLVRLAESGGSFFSGED